MISVENLSFAYGTAPPAIRDLSFEIAEGEIFGFLGPSGAGKSTTQKILIRLLRRYSGRLKVCGRELSEWGSDYFENIGVCFEMPSHYRKLTAVENLQFFASFYTSPTRPADELLELVGLGDARDKRVEHFSKGMQIRLNFARALLHCPPLLFLDEPTAGLDPVHARMIRQIILDQKARGATIFLTTHDMAVADELCDRVGFLVDGRLTSVGAPEVLRLRYGTRVVRIQYKQEGAMRDEEFPLDGLADNERFQNLIRLQRIETMHSQETTLEDVFIKVTGTGLS